MNASGQNGRGHTADARVAIIGAGFGGLSTAVKLKQAGIDDFVVYERSPAPGGTWLDNTYPGCEVDLNSQIYSLSYMPYGWSSSYAPAAELQQYVEDTVDHFDLRAQFEFDTTVQSITWDEARGSYRVVLGAGDTREHSVVVSAVGFLNVPKTPDVAGLADFAGTSFHTARWDHSHDLTGRRVAIVGTGSTAVQVTSAVAEQAAKLYVFQREPGWILPKPKKRYRAATIRRRQRWPWTQKLERFGHWLLLEVFLRNVFKVGSVQNKLAHRLSTGYINRTIKDPVLRGNVTPGYPFGCKRAIFDGNFYKTLTRANVELVPRAVSKVTSDGVTDATGAHHVVDTLIFATGFKPQQYLASLAVRGRSGVDLHAFWGDRPRALLGITVPGFPNFFMLYGPNTNGGNSIIFQLERQAEATVRMIKKLERTEYSSAIDTRRRPFERFTKWVDAENEKRVDAALFCNNYYFSEGGTNVTQWPRGSVDYWVMTRVVMPLSTFLRPLAGPAVRTKGRAGQRAGSDQQPASTASEERGRTPA